MKAAAWRIVYSVILFSAGIWVGWAARPHAATRLEAKNAKTVFKSARARTSPLASAPRKAARVTAVAASAQPGDAAVGRLRSLSWLCRNKLVSLNLKVFAADGLDSSFVKIFGLTPSQVSALNQAFQQAKSQELELQREMAKVEVNRDAERITLDIPPSTERGGQIYNELLAAFRDVLGPEKYAEFNSVVGSGFDEQLDSFGTEHLKYEVSVQTDAAGQPVYSVEKSFSLPDSAGSFSGRLQPGDVTRFFPLLGEFIPFDFGKPSGGR